MLQIVNDPFVIHQYFSRHAVRMSKYDFINLIACKSSTGKKDGKILFVEYLEIAMT